MTPSDSRHLEDADLVQFLDEDASNEDRAPAAAHLGACGDCARRLESVRAETAAVHALIDELHVRPMQPARRARSLAAVRQAAADAARDGRRVAPVRRRPALFSTGTWSGGLARAAAVAAVFLAAGGLAASPAGAWIAERVRGLFEERPAPVTDARPHVAPAQGSIVAFAPVGTELILELASTQDMGSLTLSVHDVAAASVRATGGDKDLDVVVLPASLHIRNEGEATASYEVIVPARIQTLRVRVGAAQELVFSPAELGAGWSVAVGLRHGNLDDPETGR